MIRVDADLCDQCGTCIGVCPADAIIMTSHEVEIDHSVCIQCLACIQVCPVGALGEE